MSDVRLAYIRGPVFINGPDNYGVVQIGLVGDIRSLINDDGTTLYANISKKQLIGIIKDAATALVTLEARDEDKNRE